MTKTAVFSAIAVLAFSALPASAQTVDNFVKRLAPPPSVSVAPNPLSWGGFYFGAGWGREKKSLDQGTAYQTLVPGGPGQPSNEPVSLATTNYLNRGHILGGYLWQYERFLLGAEGDYSFGDRVRHQFRSGPNPAIAASERPAIISAEARLLSDRSRRGGMCAG